MAPGPGEVGSSLAMAGETGVAETVYDEEGGHSLLVDPKMPAVEVDSLFHGLERVGWEEEEDRIASCLLEAIEEVAHSAAVAVVVRIAVVADLKLELVPRLPAEEGSSVGPTYFQNSQFSFLDFFERRVWTLRVGDARQAGKLESR